MVWSDILLAQLTDPFRIGLMLALGYMTLRLRAQSGVVVPLVAGVLFFAVMLATSMPIAGAERMLQMGTGVVANGIIVAVLAAIWIAVARFRS
jgi:MFS-type transporter involved in bile tolerance (Atg22 family)